LRILFCIAHRGHARNFEWFLREALEAGHDVSVALDAEEGPSEPLASLESAYGNFHVMRSPLADRWLPASAGYRLRLVLDYLRYFEPGYALAAKARRRAGARSGLDGFSRVFCNGRIRWAVQSAARAFERRVPPRNAVGEFIDAAAPDVMLVTPVVELGSPQVEHLRAAHSRRIPTVLPVASWDNLTLKGGLHAPVSLVTVWNEAQAREAVDLHGLPRGRVIVTGAVAYDHWFQWVDATPRDQFCVRAGLDPSRPYVLYLCSSRFIAPDEEQFIRDWLAALRAESQLETIQVLVRPHPDNPFHEDALGRLPGVSVYPSESVSPTERASRQDYYDSIFHAGVVVAVNTSGFIESAILGRPAHTLLGNRYGASQLETIHFRYLLEENGGPVRSARTLSEHASAVRSSLAEDPMETRARMRPFLESFVRPFGLSEAASPRLLATVEALESQQSE